MTRRIVVDENILAGAACFGQFGEVQTAPGRRLGAADVKDADALIVRSVTPVNAALLAGSQVRFVGSATIGTDHIDADWLARAGIAWASAPGCNAPSVVDYCLSALCVLEGVLETLLARRGRVGIIGYGNVGSRLHRRLRALGIDCIAFDPFLDAERCPVLAPLPEVLGCDVVSLHTPLTTGGPHPTRHLLDVAQLSRLPRAAVLLNAGRGEVLATAALRELVRRRPDVRLVLDVWENEPRIDPDLLEACRIGTHHIAGYSADGKLRGLEMVAQAYARFLGVGYRGFPLPVELQRAPELRVDAGAANAELIRQAVLQCYDVRVDDAALRGIAAAGDAAGEGFDGLRKHYRLRRELGHCRLRPSAALSVAQANALRGAGFDV